MKIIYHMSKDVESRRSCFKLCLDGCGIWKCDGEKGLATFVFELSNPVQKPQTFQFCFWFAHRRENCFTWCLSCLIHCNDLRDFSESTPKKKEKRKKQKARIRKRKANGKIFSHEFHDENSFYEILFLILKINFEVFSFLSATFFFTKIGKSSASATIFIR